MTALLPIVTSCDARDGLLLCEAPSKRSTVLLSEMLTSLKASDLAPLDFTVRNTSAQTATFSILARSCSCFEIEVNGTKQGVGGRFRIAPSTTAEVRIVAEPNRDIGTQSYEVALEADADLKSIIKLTSTIVCLPDLNIDPKVLVCDFTSDADVRVEKSVRVKWASRTRQNSPLVIKSTTPHVIVKSCEQTDETEAAPGIWRREFLLRVVVEAPGYGSPLSNCGGVISIQAPQAGSAIDAQRIRVVCNRKYGVWFPEFVDFGQDTSLVSTERRVFIMAADGVPFTVSEVGPPRSWLDVDIDSVASQPRHWVTLRHNPDGRRHSEALRFMTSHPDASEFRVLISCGSGNQRKAGYRESE